MCTQVSSSRSPKIHTPYSDIWAKTFDVIDDIVTIQDKSLKVLMANQAACVFFDTTVDDLIGRHCYELFASISKPCPHCPLLDTIEDREKHKAKITHKKCGKVIEMSSALVIGDGNKEYLVHIARDITDRIKTEKNLQESEERFSLAFRASPDAVNINRLQDGLYVEVNNGFTELTGFTADDVQGKTSFEIDIWNNPADRKKLINALQDKGYCENLETTFRRKDGSLTIGLMSARVINLKKVPHVISITRDIKHIRRLESEVLEQKMLFETMFNAIADGIVITDTYRNIMVANQGMTKTFGYRPEELIGRSTLMLYADPENYHESGTNFFNAGASPNDQFFISYYSHKSGQVFTGETFGVKLYNNDGKWIGNLGIMRDITERQKMTSERNRLAAAIEYTSDMIVITDETGIIQYVNPAFESVTGYTSKEVIGQTPWFLNSGEQDEQFCQGLWDTISTGHNFNGRVVNKRKDGTLFTEEATISPICDAEGQVLNYVAVKRDITEKISLETQFQHAQKLEALALLTGGVAHDFNNILSVIIGYAEMALEKVDSGNQLGRDLEHILDAGKRSASIVRQLLAFSRQQTISPKVIDINITIEEILKMLNRLMGEKISLSWKPGGQLLNIKIDPTQLDQILANLCVNAKDAIDGDGNITIETTMVTVDDKKHTGGGGLAQKEFILLSVSDDGCGMDKDTQEKIFEPFFTTKKLKQGTGLGLSTVYGIIKQNYGFINVRSEPYVGSTIEIYLPACKDVQEIVEAQPKVRERGKNETVLLVEDDAALLRMAKMMLEGQGYTVLCASSASEAIQISEIQSEEIQLLLTDVILPEMNGNELSRLLQKRYEKLKVLFMSGYTANVIARDGVLDDGVHFLQKPYSINELLSKVRKVLDCG